MLKRAAIVAYICREDSQNALFVQQHCQSIGVGSIEWMAMTCCPMVKQLQHHCISCCFLIKQEDSLKQ